MPIKETIADLVPAAATAFGNAPAFTMLGGETLSFAQIELDVARTAGGLAAAGVGKGDRVALYLPNGRDWLTVYHAIARINAVVVPINILLTAEEVRYICDDAEVCMLVAPQDRLDGISAAGSGRAAPRLIGVDDDGRVGGLLGGAPVRVANAAPDDLFTICYTSGTTGRPKGAMLTHRSIFLSTANTATIHNRVAGERVLTALPFPHVYGNVVMNAAFLAGMHLLVMPRFEASAALAAIATERPALFEGVPTMFYQMLAHPDCASTDFTSLRRCTVGGQTMPPAKIDAVIETFGCPLLELWGMTEVAGPATSHSPFWVGRPGSIGLAFPSTEVRVGRLDDPSREAVAGTAGELRVRGPQVMKGYWRNAAATAEVLSEDGWLSTGDVATMDEDGYLRIVDRLKDVIITGGYNIYPAEVEQVLAAHPSVAMVAVAGRPDPVKGEIAVAFVVLRPGAVCDAESLDRHCRDRLAAYKAPRDFMFLDDLPKTSTGKILRRALREAVLS